MVQLKATFGMNALSEGLVNNLSREDWRVSWTRRENEGGTLVYQVAADKGDVHLCAEGRGLTEALARLWQLCNQNGPIREGELAL